jgi:hypothetical protein
MFKKKMINIFSTGSSFKNKQVKFQATYAVPFFFFFFENFKTC